MWPPAPAPIREAGLVGSRLYWVGSLALHGAMVLLLMAMPGLGAVQQARSAAAEAAAVERRLKDTETRALQQGVRELEQMRRRMDALAAPPGPATEAERPQAASAPATPADLAARAQALAAAIEAADRRLQIADLARLTRVPPAEAARQLDAEAKARPPTAPAAETPAEKIARLQRQAQDVLQRAQAVRAAPEQGLRLARPPLPQRRLALGAGGEADRPTLGGKPGGTADGTAEGVGSEGGRHTLGETRLPPPGRGDGLATAGPLAPTGNGLAPTPGPARGAMPGDRHELVARAGPAGTEPAVGPGAGGRTIGPGGVYADRVYLDSWYLIGPFEGRGAQSMQLRYPPEDGVDLEASYRGLDGRLLGWAYTSRGFYPFVPPDRAENAVYYAYTELRVAQPQDLWMSFAADDDLQVWLNGQLVWHSEPADKPWYRMPFYFAHEQAASMALAEGSRRVRLEPGVHRLLVKLYNRQNYAFFSIVLSP